MAADLKFDPQLGGKFASEALAELVRLAPLSPEARSAQHETWAKQMEALGEHGVAMTKAVEQWASASSNEFVREAGSFGVFKSPVLLSQVYHRLEAINQRPKGTP